MILSPATRAVSVDDRHRTGPRHELLELNLTKLCQPAEPERDERLRYAQSDQ